MVALPRVGGVTGGSARLPSSAPSATAPLRVMTNATSRYSSMPIDSPGAGVPTAAGGYARTNVAVGFTNSGYTSAAITSRMARMEAMTTIPPRTTRRDETRSIRIRRLVRVRLTVNGRAGGAASPSLRVLRLIATYWILLSSSFEIDAGIGKYPSLMTTSWPSLESTSFMNSRVSGSSGLLGARLTYT